MAKYLPYIFFLIWFSSIIILNTVVFHYGFLRTKKVIERNSTCIPLKDSDFKNVDEYSEFVNLWQSKNTVPICLEQKARIVLLIIDALRYDFTLYNTKLTEAFPFQNKLPILYELQSSYPHSTRLLKFLADPPTTTMQRLKALTTGGLPTFIDAGSNFASTEIIEDNLITQLVSHNKSVVFMGDDTWINLYPKHFIRHYSFPSFNVMDLDTVDNGVNANIYQELLLGDWDLLIAHYLGVDHCGHKYGPNHVEMTRKLSEMDNVIRKVVHQLPSDAMLVVVGDHGMTTTGDHGGDSNLEISSALFVHAKFPLMNNKVEYDSAQETPGEVTQVNLTPTLATVLGVPIPSSNLGSLILNCLPIITKREMWLSLWQNIHQITNYVVHFSKDIFTKEQLEELNLNHQLLLSSATSSANEDNFNHFVEQAINYIGVVRKTCRDAWVEFNPFFMAQGQVFLAVVSIFVYGALDGLPTSAKFFDFCKYYGYGLYGTATVATIIVWVSYQFDYIDNNLTSIALLSGVGACSVVLTLFCKYWKLILKNWNSQRKEFGIDDIVSWCILCVSCFGFFSNSYIIWESCVTYYLLTTFLVLYISVCDGFLSIRQKSMVTNKMLKINKRNVLHSLFTLAVLFLIACKISTIYWQCREDQNCDTITKQDDSADWLASVVAVVVTISTMRAWLKYCGNLSSLRSTVAVYKYATPIIGICMFCFWTIHSFPRYETKKNLLFSEEGANLFAWVVYFLIFFALVHVFVSPLTVLVYHNSILPTSSKITPVFKELKHMLSNGENCESRVPIVFGLATAYSAPFIMATTYLILLISFLLGITTAPSLILLVSCVIIALMISSIIRFEKSSSIDEMVRVPSSSIVLWVMLASYYFFGTGHQATFSNIPWKAAFVGTGGEFGSNLLPASLVIINTFCSYILMGFSLPLLQLAPLTIYKMISWIKQKKNNGGKNMDKGEMAVFETKDYLLSNTAKLCTKYLIFHAARLLASMLAATIHSRHLMVWRVFAPRLIFESVAMLVTIASVLLGFILYVRVVCCVEKVVMSLDRQNR